MGHIDIIKLRPDGLIAIPPELRKGFKEGEELIIIREENRLMLEKVSEADEKTQEDLEFARRTDEAWKRIEAGEGKTMDFDDFIEEMKTW